MKTNGADNNSDQQTRQGHVNTLKQLLEET